MCSAPSCSWSSSGKAEGIKFEASALGNKGFGFLTRLNANIVASARPARRQAARGTAHRPVKILLDGYAEGRLDAVSTSATPRFINTMKQEPVIEQRCRCRPRASSRRRRNLATSHRRESFGGGLESTFRTLVRIANEFPDTLIVYPVHLNPNVQAPAKALLADHPRIRLLPPVSYSALLWLMSKSFIILSDSGGIQEEAPSFSKPLLVLRETTERPEAVDAGCAILVGTDEQKIFTHAARLLSDPAAYAAMAGKPNPFGDGKASQRIADILVRGDPRIVFAA